jgi:hypothetical protein
MAPYFYNVSDDDGNEDVVGPFNSQEDSLNAEDESDLNIARSTYRALNKAVAERTLRRSGSRMSSDQPLPALPEF